MTDAGVTEAIAGSRRITWSASSRSWARPDVLVHALSQLPDDYTLEITIDGGSRSQLELLAVAYGISDRVHFSPGPPALPGKTVKGAHARPQTMAELVESLYDVSDEGSSCRDEDGVLAGSRTALVTNLPAPYRIPLFNRMGRRIEAAGGRFRVFFLGRAARDRSWIAAGEQLEFEHEFLSSLEIPIRRRRPLVPIDLERRLDSYNPNLVLSAGFSPLVSGRAAVFARRRGAAFGLWSGEHGGMATARSRLRGAQRKWLLKRSDFAIAYGHAAAEYLACLRPELPIVYGRNTSASACFSGAETELDSASANRDIKILTVGDLASPRKGIDVLVDALRTVPSLPCRLTVIGGGDLLEDLKQRAARDSRICFLGSLPQHQVLDQYEQADIFAFPSRADVFGLALVEAMGAGLAVVTSDAPGAVTDLCVHGQNALVVEGHQPADWAAVLTRLVEDRDLRQLIGDTARRTIAKRWTVDHAADAMIAGLRLVLEAGSPAR